jgi:hypothetical protein
MDKLLMKKGMNTDLINKIYAFLIYKNEFDEVVQQLTGSHEDPMLSNTLYKKIPHTNQYIKSIIWWPPVKKGAGSIGYIILEEGDQLGQWEL